MALAPRTLAQPIPKELSSGRRQFQVRVTYSETIHGGQRDFVNDWVVDAWDPAGAVGRITSYLSHLVSESGAPWKLTIQKIEISEMRPIAKNVATYRVVVASGNPEVDDILEYCLRNVVGPLRSVEYVRANLEDAIRTIVVSNEIHLLLISLDHICYSEERQSFTTFREVTDLLRFVRTRTHCPIIAFCFDASDRSVRGAVLAAGANFVLPTPFEPEELTDALEVCALGWPRT